MRRKFSASELRLAQRVSDLYNELRAESRGDTDIDYMVLMEKIKRSLGVKGDVTSGAFRVVLVTKRLVFKLSMSGSNASSLKRELKFIQKMKLTEFSRHFPLSIMCGSVMMQERVKKIAHFKLNDRWENHVDVLGHRLGISDVHDENYGWAGPKSAPWPVFVDVDFRKKPTEFPRWLKKAA